ncbi:hypothetical protein [Budvicia aquatica]|uniref:Uncharacterized protein n=1 Tax=Budvicia aquatica TaxID=82979 RepID=A0A484ZK11_9GAMM|nr:hypothetical protein [Budvicia aquatica]VFS48061.1 Uncharacterised protein [Budvicia aquatica]
MANKDIVDSNGINKSTAAMKNYTKSIKDASEAFGKLSEVSGTYNKNVNRYKTLRVKIDKDVISRYSSPYVESDSDRRTRTVFNGIGLIGGKYGKYADVTKLYVNAAIDEKQADQKKENKTVATSFKNYETLNLKDNKTKDEFEFEADYKYYLEGKLKLLNDEKNRERISALNAYTESKNRKVFKGEGENGRDFIIEPDAKNINRKKVDLNNAEIEYEKSNRMLKDFNGGLSSSSFNDSIKDVANIGRGDNSADDLSKINMLYIQQHGCVSELIRMKREEREEERLAREAAQEEEKRQAVNAGRKSAQNILDDRVSPIDKVAIDERNQLEAINQLQQNDPLGAEGLLFHRTYEDAKTAITEKASETRKAMMDQERQQDMALINTGLGSMSTAANGMMDILEKSGKKQSNSYKVMFALSKSFAVAQASLSLYTAVMKAMGKPIVCLNVSLILRQLWPQAFNSCL